MSREIKFRAWDKIQEIMRCDLLSVDVGFGQCNSLFFTTGSNEKADNCILEQYTGLKDKNGVELYEGDIVLGYLWIGEEKVYHSYIIEWCHTSYRLTRVNHNSRWGFSDVYELVIVGNIHEI